MSDLSRGPGWWLALDGRWYPPELHPDYVSPRQPVASVPASVRGHLDGARTASAVLVVAAYLALGAGGLVTWRLVSDLQSSSSFTRWWVGALSGGATVLLAATLCFFGLALRLLRGIVAVRR